MRQPPWCVVPSLNLQRQASAGSPTFFGSQWAIPPEWNGGTTQKTFPEIVAIKRILIQKFSRLIMVVTVAFATTALAGCAAGAADTAPSTAQDEHFYQATITPAERGSRVVLSVSMRTHTRSSSGTKTTPESEVQACRRAETPAAAAAFQRCEQQMARVKDRLDSLARRVQVSSR